MQNSIENEPFPAALTPGRGAVYDAWEERPAFCANCFSSMRWFDLPSPRQKLCLTLVAAELLIWFVMMEYRVASGSKAGYDIPCSGIGVGEFPCRISAAERETLKP